MRLCNLPHVTKQTNKNRMKSKSRFFFPPSIQKTSTFIRKIDYSPNGAKIRGH